MSRRALRIAVISQYFHPENFIINDLVRELHEQGHDVEVFTGKPNYPMGCVYEGYTAKDKQEDSFAGVKVHRCPLRPRKESGAKNLLLNYLSFAWNGVRFFPGYARREKFNVYFVFAPSPITSVIPALAMKAVRRAPVFLWVQDLWPESLQATGFVRNNLLLGVVGLLVRSLYAVTDVLLVQSKAFIQPVGRYANRNKVIYYPNSYLQEVPGDNAVALPEALTHILREHFCVVFAGNLGSAQGLATIIEVAQLLRDQDSSARIVLVGDGSKAQWLADRKVEYGLDNLILAGAFPKSAMPELFELSSALLVTLKREKIFSYTIPSKIQAYLAAGRPIIASLDGEGAHVVAAAGAGMACSAEDAVGLAACIQSMQALSLQERVQLGNNGKSYYLKHFELRAQCKRLVQLFEQQLQRERNKK